MRIFKNKWFVKFAEKANLSDDDLRNTVAELAGGQEGANLGGGVYKKRIARQGEGKRGGYRSIVFFRAGERAFFVYGFAKSDMDNITGKQEDEFKKAAKVAFAYSEKELDDRVKSGMYTEI